MKNLVRTKHVAFLALILLLPWVSACTESDAMNALTLGGSAPVDCGACGLATTLGDVRNTDFDTATTAWYATQYTSTAAEPCICAVAMRFTGCGDPTSTTNIGVAIYADDGATDYPTGNPLISGSSDNVLLTLASQPQDKKVVFDGGATLSVPNATKYFVAYYIDGAAATLGYDAGGITRKVVGETDHESPPSSAASWADQGTEATAVEGVH